jgi:drug/metabolite transporter (DMT)-like permease
VPEGLGPAPLSPRLTARPPSDRPTPDGGPPFPPLLACAVAILAISTASIFIRFAQEYAPSLVITAWRLTLAAAVLFPIAWLRHRAEWRGLTRRDLGSAFLSGVFLAFHFATWITSLEYTSVASSVILVCTSPLIVALAAPFVLREPLTRNLLAGVLLAVAGGAVVALADAGSAPAAHAPRPLLGNALALLGAFLVAGYFMIGRRLRAHWSLLTYVTLTYGSAALVALALLAATGSRPVGYPPAAYLWFALLAFVPQLAGHSTFNWALRYLPAANVSLLVLGEPVGTILLACLILHEAPGPMKILGGTLVLGGIYLGSRPR